MSGPRCTLSGRLPTHLPHDRWDSDLKPEPGEVGALD